MDSFKKFVIAEGMFDGAKDWWHGKPSGYHGSTNTRQIYDGMNDTDKQQVAALMKQSAGGSGMPDLSFEDAIKQVMQMQKSTAGTRQAMSYKDPTFPQVNPRGYSMGSQSMMGGNLQAKDLTPYQSKDDRRR